MMLRIDYSKLYAIHKKINPAAMAVVYAQGWSASPDYMTFEEAAAVSDIGTAFKGKTAITQLTELRHFTGLNSIKKQAFMNCSNLQTVTFPTSVTTLEG